MTRKLKPSKTVTVTSYDGEYGKLTTQYSTGSDLIEYSDGRRLPSGHWPWKECHHVTSNLCRPFAGEANWTYEFYDGRSWANWSTLKANLQNLKAPKRAWNPAVLSGILDQLDLNSSENVLLYSGVLQAVPLLGGALKFTSVLNRAARNLSKSFRKKPFTTVVKSLISADFIDRFVISPTIDDARRFMDATNYVIRVVNTARERNAHPFALDSSLIETDREEKWTSSSLTMTYGPKWDTENVIRVGTEHKAFMLLEATYDMAAVDPLKVWMRRVGLTRPLDSVWDLVPFSFVIDYFTRAGDFISHLSDEMSKSDGLSGRITRILDCWGSVKNYGIMQVKGIKANQSYISSWMWPYIKNHAIIEKPMIAEMKNLDYSRFRVTPIWKYIADLQQKVDDYLSINLDLSSTRKRTIAELIIQAKL